MPVEGLRKRRSQQLSLNRNDSNTQRYNHETRVWQLEGAINDNTMPPFTAPGGPWTVQTMPPKWYAHYDFSVVAASVTLGVDSGPGIDFVGEFLVDGGLRWSVHLEDVDRAAIAILNEDILEGSVVQVRIASDGYSDITWQLAMYRQT